MCTAITYQTKDHYFGRNLDLEYSYSETVTVTPRNYPFHFRKMGMMQTHYAMIGMAYVVEDYPLYYDATNETGLSMAGLNFPGNACYHEIQESRDNVSPFEFIPWVLGQCANLEAAQRLLARLNLAQIPFSEQLPLSPLHWIIADRSGSLVVESMQDGLRIHPDPVGVLTNNPPFDYHMTHLNQFLNLTPKEAASRFSDKLELQPFSKGMGALGLPGDLSSASRFVRAAFVKLNSVSGDTESESISQFFHILNSVAMPRGCVRPGEGEYEITQYTSCCNTDRGIYYYTTYENSQIAAVALHAENLDGRELVRYPLIGGQQIHAQNGKTAT